MDDVSKLTSIDWGTILGVLTFLGTAGSALAGAATWYLNRLIQDGLTGFGQALSGEYVSKEEFNLYKVQTAFALKEIDDKVSDFTEPPTKRRT